MPRNVDAEMLVEAAVLGREHRLDQVIGELVERDRIVLLDAAGADLVAVAVEKDDGEFGLLQPVLVGGLVERGNGEREHQDRAAQPEGQRFRNGLDEKPAPPTADVEAVHEDDEPLEQFAPPVAGLKHREVEARVDVEQNSLDLRFARFLLAVLVVAFVHVPSHSIRGCSPVFADALYAI